MRLLSSILLIVSAFSGLAQSNIVKVSFADLGLDVLANRKVELRGVQTNLSAPYIISREFKRATTDTNGVCYFTNVVAGAYDLSLASTPPTTVRIGVTNSGTNVMQAYGLVGVASDGSAVQGYTQAAANSLFYLKSNPSNYVTAAITNGLGGGGTTYTNANLTVGVISGSGIGTNTTALARATNTVLYSTDSSQIVFASTNGAALAGFDTNGLFFQSASAEGDGLLSYESISSTRYPRYLVWSDVTNKLVGMGLGGSTSTNGLATTNYVNEVVNGTNAWLVAAIDLKTGFADATNIATAVLNTSDSLFATDNGGYYSVSSDKPISYAQTNSIPMEILAYTIGITNHGSLGTNVLSVRPSGLEFGDFECDTSNLITNAASYVFPVPYTGLTNDPFVRCTFFISTPASGVAVFVSGYQISRAQDTAALGRFDSVSAANLSSITTNSVTFSSGVGYRLAVTDFKLTGLGSAISTNGGNVGRFFIYRLGQNASDTSTKPCILHSATLNYLQ